MSKCGRTAQLEFTRTLTPELEAHAAHCNSCAHELDWKRTEEALFSQRRGRAEVRALSRDLKPKAAGRTFWSPVAMAIAASVFLALGLGLGTGNAERPSEGGDSMSLELASFAGVAPSSCSMPQPGNGFACEPVVLASFR